jgi:hypothetical protein
MNKYHYFYGQIVTDDELRNAFDKIEQYLTNQNSELDHSGIFDGLAVSATSPISMSVEVTAGAARESGNGFRIPVSVYQTFDCNEDEYGNSTISDLLAGEGRWCSLYIRYQREESNPRTDDYGTLIYYDQMDGFELFIRRGTKGNTVDKDTLDKPATIGSAVLLCDLWFEDGATFIESSDIVLTRRQEYFRKDLLGTTETATSIKGAIDILSEKLGIDLLDADQPTGADDGAHYVGLGGHDSQSEFQWADGGYLTASGDNVHEALKKIVTDLGNSQGQSKAGGRLISADNTKPIWADSNNLGDDSTIDSSVMGYIEAIVGDLASVNGEDLIGVSYVSVSYLGEIYSITTATTIKEQIEQLAEKILTRIDVEGDDRIAGNLLPATTDTHEVGSASYLFQAIHTNRIITSSNHCEIGSTDSGGGGTAFVSYDTIVAYLETIAGDPVFYPTVNNDLSIGTSAKRIKEIYATDINVDNGNVALGGGAKIVDNDHKTSIIQMHACAQAGLEGSFIKSYDGDYLRNRNTTDTLWFPINLRNGQIIQNISVYCGHTTTAKLDVILMDYNTDGGYSTIATQNFTGFGYRDVVISGLNYIVTLGKIPVVKVEFTSYLDQRVYNCRVEFENVEWPL